MARDYIYDQRFLQRAPGWAARPPSLRWACTDTSTTASVLARIRMLTGQMSADLTNNYNLIQPSHRHAMLPAIRHGIGMWQHAGISETNPRAISQESSTETRIIAAEFIHAYECNCQRQAQLTMQFAGP
jgi:hypothetical protein